MPTYSDSEMRAIMGRALQIDSGRSERFTPEQLRTIAAELGISTQALEVALYEADSKGVGPEFQQMHPLPARGSWAKGVAIAVGILIVAALGFGFMRMTVSGSDAARVPGTPVPAADAPPLPTKTAPARPTKTTAPTIKKVAPPDQEAAPTKSVTKKVAVPPQ
jgi:hypothetical protein